MPRFVILEHDHPSLHWDFMLEAGEVLRTWRLSSPPQPGEASVAEAIGDHRPAYLDYEGPVSGGRGSVKRWDAGTFTWIENNEEEILVHLAGQHIKGRFHLVHRAGQTWRATLITVE